MSASPKPSNGNRAGRRPLSDSPATVLIILFAVTGALGLPLLWWSPAFTPTAKWLWSIVVVVYTILLVGVTVAIVWWAYTRLSDMFF